MGPRSIKFRNAPSGPLRFFILTARVSALLLRHRISAIMAVVAIIPARYGSTRLPGKPLARIGGKPMIQHVYESASKARGLDRVLVATDDHRVEDIVKRFGGEVVMTSKDHASGTDRLAEVARKIKADLVVNVQGDLPFIHAETISRALRPMKRDPTIPMGTVCTPIIDRDEWRNCNIVKVIMDRSGFALYFSRSPIPYYRDQTVALGSFGNSAKTVIGHRHLGLYVYRRDFLIKFARLRPTALEQIESLEQLRALAYGYRIYVTHVEETSVEVDTAADLKRAEKYLSRLN
jgi:3-deoxy-manno-octulosonate cytidylyltransferase (CMP-KDO synthetase)